MLPGRLTHCLGGWEVCQVNRHKMAVCRPKWSGSLCLGPSHTNGRNRQTGKGTHQPERRGLEEWGEGRSCCCSLSAPTRHLLQATEHQPASTTNAHLWQVKYPHGVTEQSSRKGNTNVVTEGDACHQEIPRITRHRQSTTGRYSQAC